jgi:3',5'-cyclic-nucleotide phosphodiesterase
VGPRTVVWLVALVMVASLASSVAAADKQPTKKPTAELELVVLGDAGGIDESALTSLLVRDVRDDRYALVDAGVVHHGLKVAWRKGAFDHLKVPQAADRPATWLQRNAIGPVLITHPHLDHVSGLAITSPDDAQHPLYGLPSTLDGLRDSVFNWTAWPNFGSEGERPLGTYRYQRLTAGRRVALAQSRLKATAMPLSHAGMTSTAFLLEGERRSVAVLGDTGADAVEKSERLANVWAMLAPEVKRGRLKAIVMEASYPSTRPDGQLFGHLTPKWLLHELSRLALLVDPKRPKKALRGLTVVVMHVKPAAERGRTARELVLEDLNAHNDLGVTIVLPRAGDTVRLY